MRRLTALFSIVPIIPIIISLRSTARLLSAAFILTISACSIHQLDIQQGNVITNDMTNKLKIGMDRNQVRFILGTPLINDPFHENRWDYVFSLDSDSSKKESTHITVFFQDNKVVKFNGTVALKSRDASKKVASKEIKDSPTFATIKSKENEM